MRSKKNYSNVVASNRRATYDYEILDKVEAGLVLMSSEVKSIRQNRVSLAGSYAYPFNGELWLNNAHIAIYPYATRNNHEPLRSRKLLLKKRDLVKLSEIAKQKGYSLVPLKLYFSGHYAKIELGIGRGKRNYDKRRAEKERERNTEARAAIRRASL
jgi:SsrA-binding protein